MTPRKPRIRTQPNSVLPHINTNGGRIWVIQNSRGEKGYALSFEGALNWLSWLYSRGEA